MFELLKTNIQQVSPFLYVYMHSVKSKRIELKAVEEVDT